VLPPLHRILHILSVLTIIAGVPGPVKTSYLNNGAQGRDPEFPARAPEAPPGQGRPVRGNSPNARKDHPDSKASQESLRRSPIRQLRNPGWSPPGACTLPVEPRAPHPGVLKAGGIYRSDVVLKTIQTWGRGAASRCSAPGPVKGRDGRRAPYPSSAMSSGRLFPDRVARQQSPSPLHRRPQINMHSSQAADKRGRYYFAPGGDISTSPRQKAVPA